jgi:hypothetical protein
MHRVRIVAVALLSSLASLSGAWADDVTYFEKDGVTYRETRRKVTRPVTELQYQDRPQTVLRDQVNYGTQNMIRTYQVPVTEYQPVTRMVGRWNPFIRQPYYEQRQVPVTRWETRSDTVQVPVSTRQTVADTVTAKVPVYSTRVVEDEIISRVAVGTRPNTSVASAPTTTIASAPITTTISPPPTRYAPASSSPTTSSLAASPTTSSPTTYSPMTSSSPNASPTTASSPAAAAQVPRGVTVGGVSKLDSDPPRMGNNVQWRAGSVAR